MIEGYEGRIILPVDSKQSTALAKLRSLIVTGHIFMGYPAAKVEKQTARFHAKRPEIATIC
jgi:hypothetical protein